MQDGEFAKVAGGAAESGAEADEVAKEVDIDRQLAHLCDGCHNALIFMPGDGYDNVVYQAHPGVAREMRKAHLGGHFDFLAGDEALHGRLLPGEGVLPLHDVLRAVPDVAVSVELRSSALMPAFPDPTERASAVLAATRSVLAGE